MRFLWRRKGEALISVDRDASDGKHRATETGKIFTKEPGAADRAKQAEDSFQFEEAFRWYAVAADGIPSTKTVSAERWSASQETLQVDERAELMMRSARSLEMAEDWRRESCSWEWLANELGWSIDRASLHKAFAGDQSPGTDPVRKSSGEIDELLSWRYKVPSTQVPSEYFYVVSDEEWRDPPHQHYDEDVDKLRRHHRASAFEWAANHALSAQEYADAARLFRRAGVAWEQSFRLEKNKRAAVCYYQASLSAAATRRYETRRRILDAWCPACLREKGNEEKCQHDLVLPGEPSEAKQSDLERLERCSNAALSETKDRNSVYNEFIRQLAAIQGLLAVQGSRSDAILVYRLRCKVRRQQLRSTNLLRWLLDWFLWMCSRKASSVGWTMLSMSVVYLLLIPSLWWISGAARTVEAHGSGPRLVEAVVFSLSSLVTLTTGRFQPGGWITNLFQAVESLSGIFVLGYLLWIAQRSFQD